VRCEEMPELRTEPVPAPADLLALVRARLDAEGEPERGGPWAKRVAYAGALAATAGAAGAIALVATRSRRVRLAS